MNRFTETQHFNQPWLKVLFAIIFLISFVPFFVLQEEFATSNFVAIVLSSSFLIPILVMLFVIYILRLETKIDNYGIHYRFYPFRRNLKTIPWREIKSCEVVKYSPIADYGGWGYRFGRKGKALNVRGNMGIQLVFQNEKRLLLGTQNPQRAQQAIQLYVTNNK